MGWASGRHALITGGGTGIGAAAARMLAAEGAKLSLLGRRREPLEAVAAETGGTAIPCDLTDRAAMEAAFAEARAANGPFDLRHPQRRDRRQRAVPARRRARAFDLDHRHQFDRGVRRRPARPPRLARGRGQAADHRRLGRGAEGRRLCRALCRVEAWRGRPRQEPGARIRQDRPDRQRHLPGIRRHADGRRQRRADQPRDVARSDENRAPRWPRSTPTAGWSPPTKSAPRSSICAIR